MVTTTNNIQYPKPQDGLPELRLFGQQFCYASAGIWIKIQGDFPGDAGESEQHALAILNLANESPFRPHLRLWLDAYRIWREVPGIDVMCARQPGGPVSKVLWNDDGSFSLTNPKD